MSKTKNKKTNETPDTATEKTADAASVTADAPAKSTVEDASNGPVAVAGFYRFHIEDPSHIFPDSGVSLAISKAEDTVRGGTYKVPMVLHTTLRVPTLRCANVECPHRERSNGRAAEWVPEPPLRNLTLAKSRALAPEEGKEFEQVWLKRHQNGWLCPHCLEKGISTRGIPVKPSPQLPTPFRDVPVIRWLTAKEVARLHDLIDPDREEEVEYDVIKDGQGIERKVRVGFKGGALTRRVQGQSSVFGPGSFETVKLGPTIKFTLIGTDPKMKPYSDVSGDMAARYHQLEWKLREALLKDENGVLADLLKEAGIENPEGD